ncbi:MAG: TauD/TfdA family dioxygenase [Verrucomicrobiales bacterium]|nr:TauD/TfdA family dioxygenase [Verrucomicrobiales bacterium]
MTPVSLDSALVESRTLGLRVRWDRRIPDLDGTDLEKLKRALERHGVLCLPGQPVTPAELYAFTGRWGSVIELPPGLALSNPEPGFPSITRVGNLRPDGSIIPSVKFAEYWHHDGDFWSPGRNYILNFLASVQVPAVGGNTGFLDLRAAFETLDPPVRSELDGAYIWVRASEISDFKRATPEELPPDAQHPVLLPHPVSGRVALYLPDSSSGIQRKDGSVWGTVETLIDAAVQRLGIYEHVWTPGDLVLMDNLQVMHRGMGGYGDHPRLLYRCQARVPVSR